MAPVAVEEDYYLVLKVLETDGVDVIIKAYKRLALDLHPDRNKSRNATQEFQKLSEAYETLRDEEKRRIYDALHYPRIKRARGKPSSPPKPPAGNKAEEPKPPEDATKTYEARIAAILKAKQDRTTKWYQARKVYDDEIFDINREIRKIQAAIRIIDTTEATIAAEAAAVASSWTNWFLSKVTAGPVESEEEKRKKDAARLQRLHAKTINEQLLQRQESRLREREAILADKTREFHAANMQDETTRSRLIAMIWEIQRPAREAAERAARMERERIMKEQQAKWQREAQERRAEEERQAAERRKRAAAAAAKQQEHEEAKRQKRVAEQQKRAARQAKHHHHHETDYVSEPPMAKLLCSHDGWWPKLEGTKGRRACERCDVSHYTYLLECPGCSMLACASCQHDLRPARTRWASNSHKNGSDFTHHHHHHPQYQQQSSRASFDDYDFYDFD